MSAPTHRVQVTTKPTLEQIECVRQLLRAAALSAAFAPGVPIERRTDVAESARCELSDALAGRPSPEFAARCVAAALRTAGIGYEVSL